MIFAEEILSKADVLGGADPELAFRVENLSGAIVDACEGRSPRPEVSAANGGAALFSLKKEKDAALTALENMTRAYRLATLERDSHATLAASYLARIEDLQMERDSIRHLVSPMPPQTVFERVEEIVTRLNTASKLVKRFEARAKHDGEACRLGAGHDGKCQPWESEGVDEVGGCACGAKFYTPEAANEHVCALEEAVAQ